MALKLPAPTSQFGIFLSKLMERPNEWVEFSAARITSNGNPNAETMKLNKVSDLVSKLRSRYGYDIQIRPQEANMYRIEKSYTHSPQFIMYVKNSSEPLLDERCKAAFDAMKESHGEWVSLSGHPGLAVTLRRLRHKYHVDVRYKQTIIVKLNMPEEPYFKAYIALVKSLIS